MAEDQGGAGGELVAALSQRVRELQLRIAGLEAELAAARKRAAVYEEFDASIQDAIAAALRAAYDIRERADQGAGQILDQAREERRDLLVEIGRLRAERDELQLEIGDRRAEQRRGSLTVAPPPAPARSSDTHLREAAADALRGVFKELVDEMRRGAPATAPATPPEPVEPAEPAPAAEAATDQERIAAPMRPEPGEAPSVQTRSGEMQLTVTPVASFPQLVELERRIQSLPVVRTIYVRDFRSGVATLAVGLREPKTTAELAAEIGALSGPPLRVVGTRPNALDLRLDERDSTIATA